MKFVKSYAQKRSLTHFIAIPLLSPVSLPHFSKSIARLLDEPSAANVSGHDIRPLGTLHLGLGAMSLKTPERLAQSIEILGSLNYKNILEVAARDLKRGVAFNAERLWRETSSLTMTSVPSAPRNEVGPVSVSVCGLHCGRIGMEAQTMALCTHVVDMTHRLTPLLHTIRYAYREAGLLALKSVSSHTETKQVQQQMEASSIVSIKMLRSRGGDGIVPSREEPGKFRRSPSPKYDFRDLINQYKDKTWSKDIRLDRVSICRMGLTRNIPRHGGGIDSDLGLSEVFSVPLP